MADDNHQITDEDLVRAAEAPDTSDPDLEVEDGNPAEDNAPAEPAGDKPEEVVEESEDKLPPEPEDNTVRSELGRKVKEQGERLDTFISAMTDAIQEIKSSVIQKPDEEDPDDDYPVTLTAKELRDTIRSEVSNLTKDQQKQTKQYETGYMKKVSSLTAGLPDAEKAEIEKELFDNPKVNVRHSDNPAFDAQLNFMTAQNNVLRGKLATNKKPVNPLDKNKDNPDLPLGGPSETRNQDNNADKVIKLDPEAAKFAKATGMSEEDIKEALTGPMPTYLGGQ